jgi:penicillin-binding protein 2
LQLAHATGVLATGGINAKPRLVRGFQNHGSSDVQDKPLDALKQLDLKPSHIATIKKGMHGVVLEGTARAVFRNAPYEVAGKTGTAQVFSLKKGETYKQRAQDVLFRDHGWFIAFSPVEQPQIALTAIVENAGFGSQSAAPAVRAVLDVFWAKAGLPNLVQPAIPSKADALPLPEDTP